jgi:hypothetical protein
MYEKRATTENCAMAEKLTEIVPWQSALQGSRQRILATAEKHAKLVP